jgi:predicted transposase YbfD/YdcC
LWKAAQLLDSTLLGLVTGREGFKGVEAMTKAMSPAMRKATGIKKRVPDTTLRDYLLTLDVTEVRQAVQRQAKDLHYRKTLPQCAAAHAPITMCAVDGKYGPAVHKVTSTRHYPYFQPKPQLSDGQRIKGEVRLISVSLVSGAAPFFLDAVPVRGNTNEMGMFPEVLASLLREWKQCGLVDLVSVDAGSVSKDHAGAVDKAGLLYLMAVKGAQKELHSELVRQLGFGDSACADFRIDEPYQGDRVVTSVWVTDKIAGWNDWQHLRLGIRVERRTLSKDGKTLKHEDRYYATNALLSRLTPHQWQRVVRNHWLVENQCHCVLDVSFQEDRHPWSRDPHLKLIVALLRRLAFNLVSAFRGVHLRSEKNRAMPWKEVLDLFRRAVEQAGEDILVNLKQKPETARIAAV